MTRRLVIRKPLTACLIAAGTLAMGACTTGTEHDPGLLSAPGFVGEDGRLQRPWSFVHHASLGSYRLSIDDGVVAIERTGPEPSSTLAQSLPPEVVGEIAGRTLVFSADLRASLEEDTWGTPVSPTGMVAQVHSPPAGGATHLSARLGTGRQRTERLDLSPTVHMENWQRHELEFDVPADAQRVTVSFAMTAGGVLEIRNPSLTIVER